MNHDLSNVKIESIPKKSSNISSSKGIDGTGMNTMTMNNHGTMPLVQQQAFNPNAFAIPFPGIFPGVLSGGAIPSGFPRSAGNDNPMLKNINMSTLGNPGMNNRTMALDNKGAMNITSSCQGLAVSSNDGDTDANSNSDAYRDFSRVSLLDDTTVLVTPAAKSGKEPPFPVKLHRILSNPEFRNVVTWLPHGRSWRVLKPKAFEEKVIPLYFRHAKYASFMRQVNGWGFRRMTNGPDHNSYYHELFLRGLPQLCLKMHRPVRAKSGTTHTENNPDFYRLSMVAPLPTPDTPDGLSGLSRTQNVGMNHMALGGPTGALSNVALPGTIVNGNAAVDNALANQLIHQQLQGQFQASLNGSGHQNVFLADNSTMRSMSSNTTGKITVDPAAAVKQYATEVKNNNEMLKSDLSSNESSNGSIAGKVNNGIHVNGTIKSGEVNNLQSSSMPMLSTNLNLNSSNHLQQMMFQFNSAQAQMAAANSQQRLMAPGMGMMGMGSLQVPEMGGRVGAMTGMNPQLISPSLAFQNNAFASQNMGNLGGLMAMQNQMSSQLQGGIAPLNGNNGQQPLSRK